MNRLKLRARILISLLPKLFLQSYGLHGRRVMKVNGILTFIDALKGHRGVRMKPHNQRWMSTQHHTINNQCDVILIVVRCGGGGVVTGAVTIINNWLFHFPSRLSSSEKATFISGFFLSAAPALPADSFLEHHEIPWWKNIPFKSKPVMFNRHSNACQ